MVMLLLGLTVAEPHLDVKGASFWIWWGIVLLLVLTAFMMAVLDIADLFRQRASERRALLKEHFDRKFLAELEEQIGKSETKETGGEKSRSKSTSEK